MIVIVIVILNGESSSCVPWYDMATSERDREKQKDRFAFSQRPQRDDDRTILVARETMSYCTYERHGDTAADDGRSLLSCIVG